MEQVKIFLLHSNLSSIKIEQKLLATQIRRTGSGPSDRIRNIYDGYASFIPYYLLSEQKHSGSSAQGQHVVYKYYFI